MTNLIITPDFSKKTAKFIGTVAAGEMVHVTIMDLGGVIQATESLRLRAVGFKGETLAEFSNKDGAAWSSVEGAHECDLNLNTVQMLQAVPPAARTMILFVLDDKENDILYFKDAMGVDHWPRKVGEEEPVDLRGYADFVDETKQALVENQIAIEEARASASSAANSSAESATAAQGAQEAAMGSQGSAATSAAAAQSFKAGAEGAATRASQSETGAAASMTAAQTAKTEAVAARDEAKGYAESAESVLVNAATKAELQAEVTRAQNAEQILTESVAETDGKVDALVGADTGKSARAIAGEEVMKVTGGAPEAYDTLKEIADWIVEDEAGAVVLSNRVAAVESGKVDKVTGKGLSANDYTTAEKTKLAGIEAGANKTPALASVATSGSYNDLTDKPKINGVELTGNKTAVDLGLATADDVAKKRDRTDNIVAADEVAGGVTVAKEGESYVSPTGVAVLTADKMPKYGFADAAVAEGVLTLAPFSRNAYSGSETFTVLMGGETGKVRDCVFVVVAGDTAPTISWGVVGGAQKFSPRTDSATDMEIAANTTKVFWVSEYAEDKFVVAGWEVPSVSE